MEYRRLGDSDLIVSEIGIGTLRWDRRLDVEIAGRCFRQALDSGVSLIDTANVYGRGIAESLLGELLRGVDRQSYVLISKVYYPMGRGESGLSAAQVYKQCEASLSRLGVDYLDLYLCHRFDSITPLPETVAAFDGLVAAGKVRYAGFSEWTPEQISAALAIPDAARFVCSQPQYSMLWRRPEIEVFPLCAASGVGQTVYSPLAEGVLSGKYHPGTQPPPGSRGSRKGAALKYADEPTLRAVGELAPIAEQAGLSLPQLALAWVLRQPVVASAVVDVSRPEQVTQNVAAVGVKLGDDVLAAVDATLAPVIRR
jgi:aryl-alcohol dehydrogenase-like predicted oxidoreductase